MLKDIRCPNYSRRDFLRLAGLGSAALVVTACVPMQAPEEGAAVPSQEAIELGWARHGSEDDLGTEDALADFFSERYEGAAVKPLVLPWGDYNTKIPVMVAGGTAPDTFGCHPALMTETYDVGGSIIIDDYIKAAEPGLNYDDILYKGDASFDGHIYGLPQKSCTHQLRYNKSLFEEEGLPTPAELYWEKKEEGWNWNAFIEMGKSLTKDLDGDGETDQFFYGGVGGTAITTFIRLFGGEIFDESVSTCTLNEDAAIESFQFMADIVLEHHIQPAPEMQANQLGINFPTGRIAVAGATTCDSVRDLREERRLPFAWDFVVLPAGPAGFRTWGDTDQIVISTDSPNPDMAFNWAAYRSSKEAWEESYEQGITLAFSDGPTRMSIFESKAYTEPLGELDLDMIRAGYTYTIPNPYVPRSPQPYRVLFTIIPTEIENIQRGTKTPTEAAADMCALIEEVLAES